MTNALTTARNMTPLDTGVLRYDATRARIKSYGFDILWSKTIAPYVQILQEGRGYNAQYKGFLDEIGHTMARQIANGMMGKKNDAATWKLSKDFQNAEEVSTRETRGTKRKRVANYRMGAFARK